MTGAIPPRKEPSTDKIIETSENQANWLKKLDARDTEREERVIQQRDPEIYAQYKAGKMSLSEAKAAILNKEIEAIAKRAQLQSSDHRELKEGEKVILREPKNEEIRALRKHLEEEINAIGKRVLGESGQQWTDIKKVDTKEET